MENANIDYNNECPICYEQINENGNFRVTTPCNHSFCFKCITHAMNTNASCPFCRTVLIEHPYNENKEEGDEDDDDEDDYTLDDDEDDDEDDENCEVETIIEKFEKQGFTILDLMSIVLERRSKRDAKYTNEYLDKLTDDFYDMVDELDSEHNEFNLMSKEDVRVI